MAVEITALTEDDFIEVWECVGFDESDPNVGPDCTYLTVEGYDKGAWFRLMDRRPAPWAVQA